MSLPAVDRYLAERPRLQLAVLGARENADRLNLRPYGIEARYLAAEDHGALARDYLALNHAVFPRVPLPAWVLSDVYLLPAGITLLLDGDAIAAAWVGLPSVRGDAVGVSLISRVPGAGAVAKVFGAAILGVTRVRGVTQWSSPALRTHTRLGPLRVVGRVPAHELADTFVYETDLSDAALVDAAFQRTHPWTADAQVPLDDAAAQGALLDRAERARDVWIVPPGRDGEHLLVAYRE